MTTATENRTYNGWTNYETWCMHLWLSNDEGSYNHWRSRAQDLAPDEDTDKDDLDAQSEADHALADELKDAMERDLEANVSNGTVWADMAMAALAEVDWREIAEAFRAE